MRGKILAKRPNVYFLDMDGFLAEWKSGHEYELRADGYFRNLAPTQFVAPCRKFAGENADRVFILSAYLPDCRALGDKMEWLDEYMPEIKKSNRLFVPCGISKAVFVASAFGRTKLSRRMVLLDDYSKNLHEWAAHGGVAIKCYNGINGTHGTWKRDGFATPEELERRLD